MSVVFVNVYRFVILCRVKFGCVVSVVDVVVNNGAPRLARVIRILKRDEVSSLIHVIIIARFGRFEKGVNRPLWYG